MKRSLPAKTNQAVEFAVEKGASSWLNVFPMKDVDFTLNIRESVRDAVKLRYDWPIPECPSICVCGANFSVDHAIVCKRGGFVIQRETRYEIWRQSYWRWCTRTCKSNPAYSQSLERRSIEEQTKKMERDLMFMRGDYGKDRDPPFLMLGCVTQTRIPSER